MKALIHYGVAFMAFLAFQTTETSPIEALVTSDCKTFFKSAMDEMVADQEDFMERYLNGSDADYTRSYDFEKNVLKIQKRKNGFTVLEIEFIPVGHFDASKKIWHWAWENGGENSNFAADYHEVKAYGMENGCDKLTVDQWLGEEINAWEMAAAVNHILKGKGAARHYTPSKYTYVVFKSIKPAVD